MTSKSNVILGDCLDVMKTLPDNSVDAIITDPPYYRVKKEWWDRQWEKPEEFLKWLDLIAEQWARVLKPNGSLYCFASPKMSARVEVKLGDRFNIVNRITWQKPPFSTKAEMFVKENLRGFFPASESIIFAEHCGSENRGVIGEFLRTRRLKAQTTCDAVEKALGYVDNKGRGSRLFYRWETGDSLPTSEDFCNALKALGDTRPHEEPRQQYEELRQQYKELRRPFSVTADVPYTDVWTFPTVSHYPGKHPCEKPAPLLEHIIKTSTRPDAVVLDCFAGSGSTLLAAKKLGREFIGIEIDPLWVEVSNRRLDGLILSEIAPHSVSEASELKRERLNPLQLKLQL